MLQTWIPSNVEVLTFYTKCKLRVGAIPQIVCPLYCKTFSLAHFAAIFDLPMPFTPPTLAAGHKSNHENKP